MPTPEIPIRSLHRGSSFVSPLATALGIPKGYELDPHSGVLRQLPTSDSSSTTSTQP
jgi:hypothetical protein